jgi:hypothetical protein
MSEEQQYLIAISKQIYILFDSFEHFISLIEKHSDFEKFGIFLFPILRNIFLLFIQLIIFSIYQSSNSILKLIYKTLHN